MVYDFRLAVDPIGNDLEPDNFTEDSLMRFGAPMYFHFFWLMIPLILFLVSAFKKKRALVQKFCGSLMAQRLVPEVVWKNQKQRNVLLLLALFFGLLSLTQPRWGYQWEEIHSEGVDIIVALDVSNSMLAEDVKPSRLKRAQREISDLLNLMNGDRIGLVAFAGTAFLQCPLTLDYSAARIFLETLDSDLIPVQGTALGTAIRTAVQAFSQKEKKSKALILITDGEDQEGDAQSAAQFAAEQGVKIFIIGVGGEQGAPIPEPEGGFKKDQNGEVVLTKLDETALIEIAKTTQGSYVRSISGDLDLETIYFERLKKNVTQKELNIDKRKRWQERFQWPAFLALICLGFATLQNENKPSVIRGQNLSQKEA